MFFEAETNGLKYQISLRETRTHWKVGLKPEDRDWVYYDVNKKDYQYLDNTISFIFKNSSYLLDTSGEDTDFTVYTRGTYREIKIFNDEMLLHESLKAGGNFSGGSNLSSGMPGKITKVMVEAGQEVTADQPLLIMEAMKMENEMRATQNCKIKEVHVEAGENVEAGTLLISFE